jgi:hypothetical protein
MKARMAVLCLCVLAAASGAMATSYLDVGTQDHIFSDPGYTRGYWFTSPTDFTIYGLRVPVEDGTGPQNIAVVRLSAAPPSYSSTTNSFSILGVWTGVPGTGFVSTDIDVKNGDIIGVLGTRGTGIMDNSYRVDGDYSSSIYGLPVTLTRFGMQHNLYTLGTVQDVWQEPGGPIARVEMQFGEESAVPEPLTILGVCTGIAGLAGYLRRRGRAAEASPARA